MIQYRTPHILHKALSFGMVKQLLFGMLLHHSKIKSLSGKISGDLPAAYHRLMGPARENKIRVLGLILQFLVALSFSSFCSASMASNSCRLLGKLPYKTLLRGSIAPTSGPLTGLKPASIATIATYKVPKVENENNVGVQRLKPTATAGLRNLETLSQRIP